MTESVLCKHCGTPIPAENISDGELAICDVCDVLNNLSDKTIPMPEKDKSKQQRVPSRVHFVRHPHGIEVICRRMIPRYTIWLVLAIFGLIPIFIGLRYVDSFRLTMSVIVVLAVLITIAGYIIAGNLLNQTSIMIHKHGIEIKMHPILFSEDAHKFIPRSDIQQVYCRRSKVNRANNTNDLGFDVAYVEKGQYGKLLLPDVVLLKEALFIEQAIERSYGLKNEAVVEEVQHKSYDYSDEPPQQFKNQASKKG